MPKGFLVFSHILCIEFFLILVNLFASVLSRLSDISQHRTQNKTGLIILSWSIVIYKTIYWKYGLKTGNRDELQVSINIYKSMGPGRLPNGIIDKFSDLR